MSLLLDAVKLEMRMQNGLELRLYVHKDNHVAKKAYEKSDFTHCNYEIMILKETS